MKTIAFVMPKLGGGGAERVVSTIINHLDGKKYKIYLIVFEGGGEYQKLLKNEIEIIELNKKRILSNSIALIKVLRFLKVDIVFSSMRTISSILGLLKLFIPKKTKLIFRENNTPSSSIKESRYPWLWKIIYNNIFKRSYLVICQSDLMIEDFKENFNFDGSNLIRIYNPVDINLINTYIEGRNNPYPLNNKKNVVTVGKMTFQKGIDSLLKTFAEQEELNKNVELWIIGEGKLLEEFKKLSEDLGISNEVHFIGKKSNPFIYMKYSDLFILPSRYEGLPNVLLEAIVSGCPVVTTNHPGGTNEIMNIINCPNRIVELNWNKEWYKPMHYNKDEFKNYFEVSKVVLQYQKIFDTVN